MLQVVNIKQSPIGTDQAIKYIQKVRNNQTKISSFYDEFSDLSLVDDSLNDFYLLVNDEKIIGCCGLVQNDVLTQETGIRGLHRFISMRIIVDGIMGNF